MRPYYWGRRRRSSKVELRPEQIANLENAKQIQAIAKQITDAQVAIREHIDFCIRAQRYGWPRFPERLQPIFSRIEEIHRLRQEARAL